jgi:hypothetical protein
VPSDVRPIFIRAALAAFAGFAVLGFFSAVAPGFRRQVLDIDNQATVGVGVFVVFASSMAGQTAFAARPPRHLAAVAWGLSSLDRAARIRRLLRRLGSRP